MITKHCKATFASHQNFPRKVLDAGETMVLFNLLDHGFWFAVNTKDHEKSKLPHTK